MEEGQVPNVEVFSRFNEMGPLARFVTLMVVEPLQRNAPQA